MHTDGLLFSTAIRMSLNYNKGTAEGATTQGQADRTHSGRLRAPWRLSHPPWAPVRP